MQLYNTLSRKVQDFKPAEGDTVRMYHCGPTVYNFAHIGNLRAYVFADTLRRTLEYSGYKVKQVINITDVGHLTGDRDDGHDRIEEGAKREKKSVEEIIDLYSNAFFSDIDKLGINTEGTLFPRATMHINEQIALIEVLEKKGFTYKTSDGVYFDTSKFPDYGKLGNINLKELEEGARVAKNPEKKNPTDFALWKFSKIDSDSAEKREQEWPSPWGVGFPGWHIECSAMTMKYLGETLDIHTGGIDHIPVHHNNEIAQSEAATGKEFSRFWLHNAFVNIEGSKMSKSLENFTRLATLIDAGINPLAYRYFLLTAHYRSPIIFTLEAVKGAQQALESIVRKIADALENQSDSKDDTKSVEKIKKELAGYMADDLDTPQAIALLHKTVDEISAGKISPEIISDFDSLLGLNLLGLARYISDIPENIKNLSIEREELRASNKWEESDKIRKDLEKEGFYIEDSAAGPKIRRSLSPTSSNI